MSDYSKLIARLEATAFSPRSPAGMVEREAAAALREQALEIEAEKAAHWKTCQTAAHEAEERDKAEAKLALTKATP